MSRPMRLAELLPDIAAVPADLEVTNLVMDSRALRAGDAFIAIAGFGARTSTVASFRFSLPTRK